MKAGHRRVQLVLARAGDEDPVAGRVMLLDPAPPDGGLADPLVATDEQGTSTGSRRRHDAPTSSSRSRPTSRSATAPTESGATGARPYRRQWSSYDGDRP